LSSALHILDLSYVLVRIASAVCCYLTTVREVIVGTPTGCVFRTGRVEWTKNLSEA